MAQTELANQPAIELPTVVAPASPTRKALRRFRRHRLAMLGVVIILVLVVAALLGAERAALTQNLKNANKPPSLEHPLGGRSSRGRPDRVRRRCCAGRRAGGPLDPQFLLVAARRDEDVGAPVTFQLM